MKITKRERNFIRPAIINGWAIYGHFYSGRFCWNDESNMPVQIGPVCDSLIKKGLLEADRWSIRKTKLAISLRCANGMCHQGRIYNDDMPVGVCPKCDGTGVLLETNQSL